MLQVDKVAHVYQGPAGAAGAVEALAPVSFQVADGEFVCIVGPSGCGKSTLLRIMAGLLRPTQGSVTLDGQVIDAPQPKIGLIFQQSNLMPWRTVIENVALPLELAGADRQMRDRRAADVINRVQLTGFERAYPAELSGGMAQRVAIGRALIQDPEVLLLDEPFGALDLLTREQMLLELLRLWSADRKTAIMVTHSIAEAVTASDRVLVMSKRPGHIRAVIDVPLPRPRRLDMEYSPAFGQLMEQIRAHIEAGS